MEATDPNGAPRVPHGHFSIAAVLDDWYVLATSEELARRPLARTLFGTPIVLFRGPQGGPTALLDRCAHRNVPLSIGECVEAEADTRAGVDCRIRCAYHGWEYDHEGVCQLVPALVGPSIGRARRVPKYAATEREGYVWVYGRPDVTPTRAPFLIPNLADARYTIVRVQAEMEATLHATAENTLDVPHTAFLHRGLFRGDKRNTITAIVRRHHDRVEAEYLGEPRPSGIAAKILAPHGGNIVHFDRFILPSIAQVEYALGDRSHLVITNLLTPASDFRTRLYTVATFRLPVPGSLARMALMGLVRRILAQDTEILRLQTEAIRHFDGEAFASTDVDILGPHILRLLRQAERGEIQDPGTPPFEQRVEIIA